MSNVFLTLPSDNMSMLGVTIDYGPFGFMDYFFKNFICNSSGMALKLFFFFFFYIISCAVFALLVVKFVRYGRSLLLRKSTKDVLLELRKTC